MLLSGYPRSVVLGSDDYRSLLSVLESTGRAVTLETFAESVLEGLQRDLGYQGGVLMVAEPTPQGPVPFAGAMRGKFPDRTEEYFERWQPGEPFTHPSARARYASHGIAHLNEFYDGLGVAQREFCRDFLAPSSIRDQLSVGLDTGLDQQGFLTLHGDEHGGFGARDRALLMALRPHLVNQLRMLLSTSGPVRLGANTSATELTERQGEVATLAARGLSNAEIGAALGISEATVKKHLIQAFRRLGVRTRSQLIARAGELGVATRPSPT